jgi:two-component system, OmpR family, KDP operon response regulator KdpE
LSTEATEPAHGTILVVDDDNSFRRALRVTLSGMGFNVLDAPRGEDALSLVQITRLDAVLLDVDIPGMGGVETCRTIRRANARLPILMLTAMDSEDDQVVGLEAGADDYITKPFRLRELTARLRSAVRRRNAQDTNENAPVRVGELELDPVRYRLHKSGNLIHLTPKEFEVLRYLMNNAGKPISHARLLNVVWGPDHVAEFVYLRIIVSQLRKKIEDDPLHPRYLLTVPAIGYRFSELPDGN